MNPEETCSDYVLSIDTELSDKVMRFDQAYSRLDKWPNVVQLAWCIYDTAQRLILSRSFYIGNNDFNIKRSSFRIHGIDRALLDKSGQDRREVLTRLSEDINHYNPLIVGHFVLLDYHVLAVESLRAGLNEPFAGHTLRCTMEASKSLNRNPSRTYLTLSELYEILFDIRLEQAHEALSDARATAACFFELQRRNTIFPDTMINRYHHI